jgi:type I restriction enzyme S subunit
VRWRSYPKYKPSGVEWLGAVPEHWEVRRLKTLTNFVTSGSRGWAQHYSEEGALFIRIGNLSRTSIGLDLRDIQFVSPPRGAEVERTRVGKNDVLISITAYIGSVAVVGDDLGEAYVNQHIALTRPRTDIVDSKWVGYGLISSVGQTQFRTSLYGGTKEGLGLDDVKNLFLLVPALAEQSAITAFLDRETARIDAWIGKKQRQIELLQEKRAALISHAVTKGLDPKVKIKPSGIDWLSEVPEHWDIVRFKYCMMLQRGHDLPTDQFIEGPYPVYGSNGVIGYHNEYTTMGPSITVGRSGSVGEVNYIEGNFWAHNTALYVKVFLRAVPKFSYYLLKALDVKYLSEGTAVGTLNRNYIHNLFIPLSSQSEQTEIVLFLDRETARIDALIDKVKTSIEKLKEYRTALISAAMTGKIDVRKEAA